jgi:hypothetical protein
MRQAHGAEQDGIGRAAGLERGVGQGHAAVQVVLRAGRVVDGVETAADAWCGHRLQHGQRAAVTSRPMPSPGSTAME